MLYALFGLVVADGVLSNFLVSHNLGWEWNPFLKTLVGGEQFLLIKVCGALLVMILLWNTYRKQPVMAVIGSLCSLAFYTAIIYWNLFALAVSSIS
jgi:hypothetical protein